MKLSAQKDAGPEEALEKEAMAAILRELQISTTKYGVFHSTHEGYGVLKEEVDEMWEAIKNNDIFVMHLEAVQVAAMALRMVVDSHRTMQAMADGSYRKEFHK